MQNFENNYDMITCDRLFVLDNFKIWGDDKSGFVCGLLPNEQQQNKIKCQTVFGDCHNGDLIDTFSFAKVFCHICFCLFHVCIELIASITVD